MKKKSQIVLFPTNVEAPNYTQGHIVKCIKSWTPIGENPKEINKLSISKNWSEGVLKYYEPQHLHILSYEKPKEGDWCLNLDTNDIFKLGKYGVNNAKKIIATTDTSLGLLLIPKSFIEYYISEYNKRNIITHVEVEYEEMLQVRHGVEWYDLPNQTQGNDRDGIYQKVLRLKLNPDNIINIYPIKNSWNREEVIEFGLKCVSLGMDLKNNPLPRLNEISGKEYYYKWVEQNI